MDFIVRMVEMILNRHDLIEMREEAKCANNSLSIALDYIETLLEVNGKLLAETKDLKRIIGKELLENDELGSEFVYVMELKTQNIAQRLEIAKLVKDRDAYHDDFIKCYGETVDLREVVNAAEAVYKSLGKVYHGAPGKMEWIEWHVLGQALEALNGK